MKEGLLWFDNNPRRELADKVGQAAMRYQLKFGQKPTVCYVNEVDLNGLNNKVNGIRVQPGANVLRHHFWIGVDTEKVQAKAA